MVAGLTVKALTIEHVNIYLLAAVVAFFGVIYLTFRRFVEDVKKTVEKAKQAERERAEQAEQHVLNYSTMSRNWSEAARRCSKATRISATRPITML